MDKYAELQVQPIKLLGNRVWRTYSGGKNLEMWQGKSNAQDSDFPEEWVASTVVAKNVGREDIVEGLCRLIFQDSEVTLKEVIETNPAAFLGFQHELIYGANPAILVKVLDSAERLTIQVHPDLDFARQMFSSPFGKTESWYALGGRAVNGEEPYLLLGFKPGFTREIWSKLFEEQDIQGMISSLHRIPLREGDVFLVEGGVPHAIGSGCFLIEVQEPTDLTLRTERITPRGITLSDGACHQGIGFEQMLHCFHYEALTMEETLKRWRKNPQILRTESGGNVHQLIGSEDTHRFKVYLLEVGERYPYTKQSVFCVGIVVSGHGRIVWGDHELTLKQGDKLFLPAGLEAFILVKDSDSEHSLKMVLCFPPDN